AGLAVLMQAAPAAAIEVPPRPDPTELARLADGQSQRSNWQPPGMTERYGHAEVLVHAPIATVHRAVQNYGRYKELVPSKFNNAHVVAKEGDATDVYMQVPIMHGLLTLWQVMRFRDLGPLAPGWAMVEGWYLRGNLKAGNVAWTLHAVDPEFTVLKVDLLILPNVPAPQGMIDEELRDAAAQAVEGIRDQTQAAPGPVPYAGGKP
ncbi:MAG TPA: hypothetical protein VGI39_38605, partial [Polyangiaceae bacterium]